MEKIADVLPVFRLVGTQPKPRKKPSGRKYRRGSTFIRDANVYSQTFNREQKHKMLLTMEREERRTKAKGARMGVYGRTGLDVFRAILKDLVDAKGLRAPSITMIMCATKAARQTVVDALDRLEKAGAIKRIRRLKRIVDERGAILCVQDCNIYVISAPGAESSQWKGKESKDLKEDSPLLTAALQGLARKIGGEHDRQSEHL